MRIIIFIILLAPIVMIKSWAQNNFIAYYSQDSCKLYHTLTSQLSDSNFIMIATLKNLTGNHSAIIFIDRNGNKFNQIITEAGTILNSFIEYNSTIYLTGLGVSKSGATDLKIKFMKLNLHGELMIDTLYESNADTFSNLTSVVCYNTLSNTFLIKGEILLNGEVKGISLLNIDTMGKVNWHSNILDSINLRITGNIYFNADLKSYSTIGSGLNGPAFLLNIDAKGIELGRKIFPYKVCGPNLVSVTKLSDGRFMFMNNFRSNTNDSVFVNYYTASGDSINSLYLGNNPENLQLESPHQCKNGDLLFGYMNITRTDLTFKKIWYQKASYHELDNTFSSQSAQESLDGGFFWAGTVNNSTEFKLFLVKTRPDGTVGINKVQERTMSSNGIYPNPTKNELFIPLDQVAGNVSVIDSRGCIVLQNTSESKIDVSQLPSGVYWLISKNGHKERFVKE